jgi:hypothetical protein
MRLPGKMRLYPPRGTSGGGPTDRGSGWMGGRLVIKKYMGGR